MKDELVNFVYFVNDKNYLKELSKKDNYKLFNEKIKKEKKIFLFEIIMFHINNILFKLPIVSHIKIRNEKLYKIPNNNDINALLFHL